MKTIFNYTLAIILCFVFFSCEKDNVDPPGSQLTGRLLYDGNPIYLQEFEVNYELYQEGFGKVGPMGSSFTSEGEFAHLLFNGTYKMIVPNGQGPFIWDETDNGQADTLLITVNGNTTLDIEVTPYWIINTPGFSYSDGNVTATLGLEQVVTDERSRAVERVSLYLSKTTFADARTNVALFEINGDEISDWSNISLSATVPDLVPSQNYVFASIGVKFEGLDDLLFSPTEKITID